MKKRVDFFCPRLFFIPLFLFLAGLLTGTLAGCGLSPEDKMAAHYEKGLQYMESEEYRAAVIEFRNAVQIDPTFAEARYQLGLAYIQTRDAGNAVEELTRAASLDPSNTDAMIQAAEIYLLTRQFDESRNMINRALDTDDGLADAHAIKARVALAEGNTDDAVRAVEQAMEINPDQSRYYIVLGQIHTAAGDIDQAESALKRAVELDNSTLNLKMMIGFHTNFTENGDAEQYIRMLLEDAPEPGELDLDMAAFYASRGRMDDAERHILYAVENNPHSPGLRIYLGNFYRQARLFDRAEAAFLAAVETAEGTAEDPVDEKAILADFYVHSGKFDRAGEIIGSLLEDEPGHPQSNLVRAKLLIREGKPEEAMNILERLEEEFPRWWEIHHQKGLAYINMGDARASYSAANRALELSPGNPEAQTLVAHHLVLEGKHREAKAAALSALQAMPGNLRAGITLGRAMTHLGETENAVRLFEELAGHAPDNAEVLFHKAEAYMAHGREADSIETLETILGRTPDYRPAMITLTRLHLGKGNPDDAIGALRRQVDRSPENAQYLIMLAEMEYRHGENPDEALTLLERARNANPDMAEIYPLKAGILTRQGRSAEAVDAWNALLRIRPDAVEGYMALGSLNEQAGDITAAKAAYGNALEARPRFGPAANNLAWLMVKSDNPDMGEALRLALIAKEALPEDPHVADTLGYIHYKRGAYQLALTQLRQAVAGRPDMPTLRYHYAKALYADGQTGKARAELERALEQEGEFPEREEAERMLAEMEE